jgi:hypothetical protein
MIFAVIIAAWLAVSALVCWIAGRFIRVGMVELQAGDQVEESQP